MPSPALIAFGRRFTTTALVGACIAGSAWLLATPAIAQPPGGSDRGGDRGRRGFDPEEMVARLDENKNGQIDPEEMQGRARFFLESMARDNGLDLTQPIPTAKLRELMQARFQQGGPPRDGGRPGNNSGSNSPATSNGKKTPASIPPNGFGVETKITAKVPGFGLESGVDGWDTIKAKYDARIVERVEESLNRYDKNKDGILDAEEIKNGQWRSDPKENDTNRDGKLSRSELAERHRLRELNGGGQGGGRPSFGGGPPGGFGGGFNGGGSTASVSSGTTTTSSSPSGSASKPAGGSDDRVAKYAEGLLKQYDANKDGVLQKSEWSNMRGEPKKSDLDNNDLITKEELAAQLSNYSKGSGGSSSGSSGSSSSSSKSGAGPSTTTYGARAASSSGAVKTYRFLSPVERLPKGLPDWFTRSDTNGDGQVAMGEFAGAWDEAKAAEFARWDRNGDGLITPRECTPEK